MFQPIPIAEEHIFAYKVTGKLTKQDYEDFLPKLTTLIHKYGPISMLLELEDFHGLTSKAVWEDYKFASAHAKDFKKIAIIGDRRWEKWLTVLADKFTDTDLRYFERDKAEYAWNWLRQSENNTDKEKASSLHDTKQDKVEPYERMLAVTDFSAHSEKALLRAKELANQFGTKLSIIHVLEHLDSYENNYMMLGIPDQYNEVEQQLLKQTKIQLNKLKEKLGMEDVESDILWGSPVSTILTYAQGQNVDLIIIGSHGRRGLSKLIGSTTNGIINQAQCEVLSVNIKEG